LCKTAQQSRAEKALFESKPSCAHASPTKPNSFAAAAYSARGLHSKFGLQVVEFATCCVTAAMKLMTVMSSVGCENGHTFCNMDVAEFATIYLAKLDEISVRDFLKKNCLCLFNNG